MSKKLLLADDSITIQKVIGITFANEDYELSVVDNGDAALEMARKISPDLILADVFMPGKNGYELCAAVKKDPALCHTPLLLLTGTFEPFDENKAKAAGANSWIAKPFESQALIDRVEELLAKAPMATVTLTPASPSPAAPISPAAAPAPLQATPIPMPIVPAPVAGPTIEVDDDLWGDEPADVAVEQSASTPVAEDWQTVDGAGDDDLWGGIALEEEETLGETAVAAEAESGAFEVAIDDDWGDLVADVSPKAAREIVPQAEETVLAAAAVVQPPLAGSGWNEMGDDILSLDEMDILEEEDIVETPADAFLEETVISSAVGGMNRMDRVAAKATAPVAVGSAWDDVAQPSMAPAANEAGWDLTDEEEQLGDPAWKELADEVTEAAPAASIWDMEPDATVLATPAVMAAPAQVPAGKPALAAAAIETQVASLSEEDIARMVEKVAGAVVERLAQSVLEKVVWEVVPDLAEAMIRDEIRSIKEGIR